MSASYTVLYAYAATSQILSAFACSSGLTLCLSAQPPSRPVRARAPPPHDAPALRSRIARRLTLSHSLRATHRCLAPDICKKGLSTLT